ncbi:claudin domain-containing protein 1-like isoform X2 [Phycodurus eques]|uniref:claudin domain-containing protein 1-like isoform X2 n=1 Tax=Phycodurus eques TaxID=693459 RepID=UPI002ACE04AE|nr:claudin domain-containing protein 1-like isoform X2 [Phycodurus eques]
MVDNRYATALVIACVLSLLATVYLCVGAGTQHWYQYSSPPVRGEANASELRGLYDEFMDGEFDEKTYSDTLFRLNGSVGLWWRCVLAPAAPAPHWYKEAGAKMALRCRSFSVQQQLTPKYKEPGNHNSGEDILRTYLWRFQFLLPLVALGLEVLAGLIGFCACLCRSLAPTLAIGVLHLLTVPYFPFSFCSSTIGVNALNSTTLLPANILNGQHIMNVRSWPYCDTAAARLFLKGAGCSGVVVFWML